MQGFSYHNIFETKGIEYIAILVFFAALVPFWLLLNRKSKRARLLQKAGALSMEVLNIPQGILFGKNHTWMHLDKTGQARLGVDDLLMHLTGYIVPRFQVKQGENVRKGDLLAELDKDGQTLQIFSPLSGTIQDLNTQLTKDPDALLLDPFYSGWLLKVKPLAWKADTASFMLGEEASSWMKKELGRAREFILQTAANQSVESHHLLLQDGGELQDFPLAELPAESWRDFQKNFLSITG